MTKRAPDPGQEPLGKEGWGGGQGAGCGGVVWRVWAALRSAVPGLWDLQVSLGLLELKDSSSQTGMRSPASGL